MQVVASNADKLGVIIYHKHCIHYMLLSACSNSGQNYATQKL